MAGAQERVLRRRIGSVGNTKKITRAMELISATRVTKAQQRAREARPYATEITKVIQDLSAQGTSVDHPLLRQNEDPKVVGVVVLASDRGLAGAYNASVIRAAEREVQAARSEAVSYTHLTLPTSDLGQISGVAVSLKKKNGRTGRASEHHEFNDTANLVAHRGALARVDSRYATTKQIILTRTAIRIVRFID